MAQALRRSGEQLSNEGDGQQAAELAEGAADRIERLGGYLERTSGAELVRDVEDFARRRPWMIAGMGLVAGLAASRFLKASAERRYDRHAIFSRRMPGSAASHKARRINPCGPSPRERSRWPSRAPRSSRSLTLG